MTAQHATIVMWRDASFYSRPGRARRYHIPGETKGPFGHYTAVCNTRIQLDDENAMTVGEAGFLLCRRCARHIAKHRETENLNA